MAEPQVPVSATELVHRIKAQLDIMVGVARAAEACAETGDTTGASTILLDMEPPLYEITTLLNAASLVRGNNNPGN